MLAVARQGISKDQVYSAADTLREEGTTPTVQAVRDRLGSGSFTTISRHLDEWKTDNAIQGTASAPEMPERVQAAFTQAWTLAAREAQSGLEDERQALKIMQRDMDTELRDMGAEIQRLEKALDDQIRNGEMLARERDELKQTLESTREELNALKVETARFEEQRDAARTRGDELKGQLESLQEQFTAVSKAIQERVPAEDKPKPRKQ